MFAPPLYVVRKFKFGEIVANEFNMEFDKKQEQKYLIKQSDSQLLRQIRIITGKKTKYNPYIIFVDIRSGKSDKENLDFLARNGFNINGIKYILSERSASMTRNSILSFVDENISKQLNERIGMGINIDRTVLSKYMAYRGLSLSSCHCIEHWMPKIIVVPDFEQTIFNQKIKYAEDETSDFVDKNNKSRKWTQKVIKEGVKDININSFDGMGICHPQIMEEISNILNINGDITSIMLRLPYFKGMIHQMDYSTYFKEHDVQFITDIWGWKHNVDDVMIIATESMYKGYKYFNKTGTRKDWEDYWEAFKKYNYCFGVAKWNFTIEEEPLYTRANYQILQDLEIPTDEFATLYQHSIDWIEKIINGDKFSTYCFLGLRYDRTHALNEYVKSITLNPIMLKEEGVRNYLISLFKKNINEMKCGKIYLKSTFKYISPDLIMFLEYLGGLEIKGCLEEGEFWTKGLNGVFDGEYAIERNPHLAQSEHAILNAVDNHQIRRWCSHLNNVAMVNGKSIITARISGADFDGDLINIIDDKTFISGIQRDLPIVIDIEDKVTALEETNNIDNIIQLIFRTIHSLIGETSNCATCFYNKNVYYKGSDKENKLTYGKYVDEKGNLSEIPIVDVKRRQKYLDYINLLSVCNNKNIDASKTGVIMNIPKHIAKWSKPLPYFMKYAGNYYQNMKKFDHTDTNMNIMCKQIEDWEHKVIRNGGKYKIDEDFNYRIMMSNHYQLNEEKLNQIKDIFVEFYKEMSELSSDQNKFKNYKYKDNWEYLREAYPDLDPLLIPNFEFEWEEIYKIYKKKCQKVCKDSQELANLAVTVCYELYPNKSKRFIWKVASNGILRNLSENSELIKLPMLNPNGEYEYLGKKYSLETPIEEIEGVFTNDN